MKAKHMGCKGMMEGVPIGLGYFAVSFAFGIQASKVGISGGQALLMSISNLTSAGQFVGLSVIAAGGSYVEMIMTQFIINLRYLLMSCALSQRLEDGGKLRHRLGTAYGITDEIFGISIMQEGTISPYYIYGAMSLAIPGWGLGTYIGAVCGDILPKSLNSALGIALYGMFIAVVMPVAKKDKKVVVAVLAAMLLSVIFRYAPYLKQISAGMQITLITLGISGLAAWLFPRKEAA